MYLGSSTWTTSASIVICAARRPRIISRATKMAVTATSTSSRPRLTRRRSARKPWKVVPSRPSAMTACKSPPRPPANNLRNNKSDDTRAASPGVARMAASLRPSGSERPHIRQRHEHTRSAGDEAAGPRTAITAIAGVLSLARDCGCGKRAARSTRQLAQRPARRCRRSPGVVAGTFPVPQISHPPKSAGARRQESRPRHLLSHRVMRRFPLAFLAAFLFVPRLALADDGVLDVPFIAQKPNYCGPAALAMLANFYGHPVSQDEIAGAIYLPDIGGTITSELGDYARRFHLWVRQYHGSLDDLREKLSAGVPLLVLGRFGEQSHYFVV